MECGADQCERCTAAVGEAVGAHAIGSNVDKQAYLQIDRQGFEQNVCPRTFPRGKPLPGCCCSAATKPLCVYLYVLPSPHSL